jgi:hypothetical protein
MLEPLIARADDAIVRRLDPELEQWDVERTAMRILQCLRGIPLGSPVPCSFRPTIFCVVLSWWRPSLVRRDYLHFANGVFAGCSILDPYPCTYRSGGG